MRTNYNNRGHLSRIAVGIMTLALLLFAGCAGAATNVSKCGTNISEPGEYVLNTSIIDSSVADACIKIISSDVVFDGAGYTIDGIDTPLNDGIVVHFNESVIITNVTIKNVTLTDWDYGVMYNNVLNGKIANVTARSNSKGIVLNSSSNINVTGNTAYNNTMDAVHLNHSSNNNVIRNNNVSNNSHGIEVYYSVNNTISNNNVSLNDGVGIDLINSSNNTISTNIASLNGKVITAESGIGIDQNSNNNLIIGNIANSNGNKGISIYTMSDWNTISDNIANSNGMEGIYLGYSNFTLIRNNTAKSNNGAGIILQYSNNNNITGNNASNSLDYPNGDHSTGIALDNSKNNNLSNNIVASNNDIGISLDYSVNNTLINNIATSNILLGIALFHDSNCNIIRNNSVSNNQQGIVMSNSVNSTLNGNNASSNNDTGIYISSSSNNNILTNNIANLNLWEGIFIEDSNNNTLTNNTASLSPNGDGIYIINSSYNTLTNNTANSNTLDGITLKNSSSDNILTGNNASLNDFGIHFKNSSRDNVLTNNTLQNNRWDFFLEINSTNNTVTDNRSTHTGKDYAIKTSSSPASDPSSYTNIGKYVNATNNSADSWLFLNVSYSNSDVASIDASRLRMWKYDNGAWSQVAGTNGVNTAQNYVYANITSFSIFAPMAGIGGGGNGTNLTTISGLTQSVPVSTNATYTLSLQNNGSLTDNYTISVSNPNNASYGLNITSPVMIMSGATQIFTLNVSNASSGTFQVNITANSTNDPSKVGYVNTTTTVPIVIIITNPADGSVDDTDSVNVTAILDNTGLAKFLNWNGVNFTMTPNTSQPAGTVFFTNMTGLLSGSYSFRIYANDSNGVYNVSETRIVTVNRTIVIGININTSTFITNEPHVIVAPSGNVGVTIPNGTNASIGGVALTSISVDSPAQVNSTFVANLGNDKLIGENLSLGPEGAIFIPDIQISFNYTDAMLTAAGISASELRVKFYNTTTNTWVVQTPYTLNEIDKYITANVSHFSTFALLGTPTTTITRTTTGDGGGGGGAASGEPYENIAKREVREQYLSTGVPAAYTFTTPELPVYEVIITPAKNSGTTSIQVELLKGPSKLKGVTLAPGTIFMHVNIWVGGASFATPENIKEGIIKFKVERKWLDDNNFAEGDISMLRWDGSNWIALGTQVKERDDNFTYLEAITNSFSPFAITALKEIPKVGAPVTETPAKPTTIPAVSSTEKISGFEIVLVMATLLVVYILGRKRR